MGRRGQLVASVSSRISRLTRDSSPSVSGSFVIRMRHHPSALEFTQQWSKNDFVT